MSTKRLRQERLFCWAVSPNKLRNEGAEKGEKLSSFKKNGMEFQ